MKSRDRIARIIRLKERIRDARRGELAEAERDRQHAEAALDAAEAQVIQLSGRYTQPEAEISATELSNRADMMLRARHASDRRRRSLASVEAVRDERAGALADAGRELAKLGVLDTRLEQEARRAEGQREQALLDECALRIGRTGS